MKNVLMIPAALLAAILIFPAAKIFVKQSPAEARLIANNVVSCAPPALDDLTKNEDGKYIPVLPGWGKYAYPISTKADSAQFYFNQGLNLYYSYHPKQALASFKEAARFDENCAMAYWGQALSMGPFYNDPSYKMSKQLPAAVQQMTKHASTGNEKERQLIAAMQQRYSDDTSNADRPKLDHNYAIAMATLMRTYPADADIAALYVDAVMLQHKWDFWSNDGSAKPWTSELVQLCQKILNAQPQHPAALHYYIHVTEASRHPDLALKSAIALKTAMPGTSHMVHMASHMYQRNGLFSEGVEVNEKANAASNFADALSPATGNGQNTTIHYFAVQSYCALSAGMYQKAMPAYMRARNRVVDLNGDLAKMPYLQFVYMMPVMAAVRTGKWQEIMNFSPVDRSWKYAAIMEDFARGLAQVRAGKYQEAQQYLEHIRENIGDSLLDIRRRPFNKPNQTCKIARYILDAELLAAKGETAAAIHAFTNAIAEEDGLIYSEPQEWLIPSRQFLGNYLVKLKKFKDAERVFAEDLLWHPGNGWSFIGLYQCAIAGGRKYSAAKYKAAYLRAFKDADVLPTASVF